MPRSDRRLALEPLEAADADTVRGSTLISQTSHSGHHVQRCPVTRKAIWRGLAPHSGSHCLLAVILLAVDSIGKLLSQKQASSPHGGRQVCAGGCAPRSARGIEQTQSSLESAFTCVQSLPEGARPEARAASNRAVWRVRLVAFRVFRRVRAPKRAPHPTEQSGECVHNSGV